MADTDESDAIRNPAQIAGVLKRLQDTRKLINVSTPQSHNRIHTSAVLDVNADRRMVLLDELTPPPKDVPGLVGHRIGVSAQLGGVDVSFASEVSRIRTKGGTTYYIIALPGKLLYQQRREHFRAAATAGSSHIPARLHPEGRDDAPVIEGELTDLSIGGMGIRLPPGTELPESFESGLIIPLCSVDLPEQKEPLECEAELRSIREDTNAIQLGLRFNQLDPRAHRMVEKYVVALDRKQRQRGIQ
ncbi:MAG: flagellar brake protein [Pseudomonadota bacterium]